MVKKEIFVVSGLGATPQDHWFPWLIDRINEQENLHAVTLEMPNPMAPELNKWVEKLAQEIPDLDENTYIITHSLGSITTLNYLSELANRKEINIGGLLLVSGFSEKLPTLPLLDIFIDSARDVDYDLIKQVVKDNIIVVASANDSIVPTELTDQFAKQLNADYYRKRGNGHFMKEDGFTEFPLLLQLLDQLFNRVY
ncbi:TPA: serine hydrolase family protein [Enterococcus faecalis]|nr:serine hydrolase family protein [Enterococcus faecalis]